MSKAIVKKYLAGISRKGGETTKKKYSHEHFVKIGKMGGRPKKSKKTK